MLVGLSQLPSFQAVYPMARGNSADALSMTAWLLAYGLQFVGVELFFRGFLLLVLRPVLGLWGVVVMLLPYTMLHFSKPPLETLGSVGFGLFLALIALISLITLLTLIALIPPFAFLIMRKSCLPSDRVTRVTGVRLPKYVWYLVQIHAR